VVKQLVLTVLLAAAVSGGVSWAMRPVTLAGQQTRIERIESRLQRIAKVVGLVFGEDQ
jgi:hypothetical protein